MIQTTELTRRFGNKVAVDNLTLSVESRQILGLLGPNGAGKTTTLRLLATLIRPSSGTAYVEGLDIVEEPERVRSIVGVVSENQALYEHLTVYENLEFAGKMHHVPEKERAKRIQELLDLYELWEQRSSKIGTLSKGLRQRVAIIRAVIHEPQILLLDEPTANLDPQAAIKTRKLFTDQNQDGRTIIVSTHNLREVQKLCNTIALMHEGKIVAKGHASDLIRKVEHRQAMEIRVRSISPIQRQKLEKLLYPNSVSFNGDLVRVSLSDYDSSAAQVIRKTIELGVDILEARRVSPELEEAVVKIIGEA